MDKISVGKIVYFDKQKWTIISVMSIGEEYYSLISENKIALIISTTALENKLKNK